MKTRISLPLLAALILGIASCKKNNYSSGSNGSGSGGNPPVVPVINGINPSSGPFATADTIGGSGFDPNAANDSVWFNGVPGTVQNATATRLIVLVPKYAGTGSVTMRAGKGQLVTGPVFNYRYTPVVSTFAGNGSAGLVSGAATTAEFSLPSQLTADAAGNLYVADAGNNAIRFIQGAGNVAPGQVSTVAGTGAAGTTEGSIDSATFNAPTGVAVDSTGTVYVAETNGGGGRIRKVSKGVVSLLAGRTRGPVGFADGTGAAAWFAGPTYIARSAQNILYVTDQGNDVIRSVNLAGATATVGGLPDQKGNVNGNLSVATLGFPVGIAIDAQGNIYVADGAYHCIREILSSGLIITYAGATDGTAGWVDGPASTSRFNTPFGLGLDAAGNLYVADAGNNVIRKISANLIVSTIAGVPGAGGFAEGVGSVAKFNTPGGVAVDAAGNIFIADTRNNRIRVISMQ